MLKNNENEIVEEIDCEFELDCECDLDYDDEDEDFDDEEEDEKPKKKSKKVPEKTVDDLLVVIRTLFDDVIYEILPYEIQPEVETVEDNRVGARTNCRLLCRNSADIPENKNPNIEYVNWVEFKIRNENGWEKRHIKYVIENYKQLAKDEDIDFFMKEDISLSMEKRKGLNYYLFYKSRKANLIPSFEEMMELRKATLQHIFQNGLYEEDNSRIDSFDEYDFEGYSFNRCVEDFKENGATDIELVDVFGMRLYLGIPHVSERYDGEDYMSYPYWCNGSKITDSGNNIEYSYEESVFNKDYILWLREFTGWKTKTYGSFDDEVVQELVEVLANHHRIEVDELLRLAKRNGDTKAFQKALNDLHFDSNGGGGGGQYMSLFGCNYERTKAGLEVSLTARKPHLEHYGFWNDSMSNKNRYGDTFYVFKGNAYQQIFEYHNPKIYVNLFSMFEDDMPNEPVNNMIEKRKAVQLSLF